MHAPAAKANHTGHTPTIAIIGGGVSGAAVAIHLHRLAPNAVRIFVFEPRDEIGRGLAYSTHDPVHKINVPAARMELFPDDAEHFDRWFAASGLRAPVPRDEAFAPEKFSTRFAFGSYVNQQVGTTQGLTHIRAKATIVKRVDAGFEIESDDGQVINAEALVLATGHSAPAIPALLQQAAAQTRQIISDPWRPAALDDIDANDRVLIVGTGLTMADIVASLEERGHRGDIVAISRRGQRSRSHAPQPVEPYGDFVARPIRNALQLLSRIRGTVAEAAAQDISWHAVLDQVRHQAPAIWLNLLPSEKKRVLRHLRPFWDTHRFRLAPQVSDALDRTLASRQLAVKAASIQRVTIAGKRLSVSVYERRTHAVSESTFDRIVIATGADYRAIFRTDPLLKSLQNAKLIQADSYGLGIDVDVTSRALDAHERAQPLLFVAGPSARGTFGELMGVTEISKQALRIANEIAVTLGLYAQQPA